MRTQKSQKKDWAHALRMDATPRKQKALKNKGLEL
jgi:hypothetical protein